MENENEVSELVYAIVRRIEDIGRAKEKLSAILDDEIFEKLSKHDAYFHSADEDKLDDIRSKLRWMQDRLWDVWSVLDRDI